VAWLEKRADRWRINVRPEHDHSTIASELSVSAGSVGAQDDHLMPESKRLFQPINGGWGVYVTHGWEDRLSRCSTLLVHDSLLGME